MSRTKKSRKPGGAPTAKPKLSKQELANVEKRIRKTTGKVAGNRQKEAAQNRANDNQKDAKKDPRLGNKTPIVLGKVTSKADKPKTTKPANIDNIAPMARVIYAEDIEPVAKIAKLSPEDELNAVEDDAQLQSILVKQEDGIELTEQEVNYYNDMMDRHQALSVELGLDQYDEENDDEESENESEDDLWDKLDRPNFSDFDDSSK